MTEHQHAKRPPISPRQWATEWTPGKPWEVALSMSQVRTYWATLDEAMNQARHATSRNRRARATVRKVRAGDARPGG